MLFDAHRGGRERQRYGLRSRHDPLLQPARTSRVLSQSKQKRKPLTAKTRSAVDAGRVSGVAAFFMACSSGAVGLELLNRMDLVLSNLSYPEHLIGTGFAANSQISDRMARKRRYDQSGTLRGDDFEFSAFATKRLSQVVSTD